MVAAAYSQQCTIDNMIVLSQPCISSLLRSGDVPLAHQPSSQPSDSPLQAASASSASRQAGDRIQRTADEAADVVESVGDNVADTVQSGIRGAGEVHVSICS